MTDELDPSIKTFTSQRKSAQGHRVLFELPPGSGEVYEATPDPPGGVLLDLSIVQKLKPDEQAAKFGEFFDTVLLPESRDRFEANFRSKDPTKNITLPEANEALEWLITEYAGRPTTPAADSPSSVAGTGPNSTPSPSLPAPTR
ncbi:hypothetical protein [Desertimonas flava]|uniref:hypothetical protein n=1 Tax=Desertimonas flava TaxID=2064846 RepID=UPI000E34D5D8|nr:hypothetical protein [Desertimonas flava]